MSQFCLDVRIVDRQIFFKVCGADVHVIDVFQLVIVLVCFDRRVSASLTRDLLGFSGSSWMSRVSTRSLCQRLSAGFLGVKFLQLVRRDIRFLCRQLQHWKLIKFLQLWYFKL